ncbi:UNVERIFIED_CONTAM: 28S ribosomal protein S5, mitochondrial [Siphonaria sp. JEL0065]|nr:28S ribosomal protein S5, mitochondrial [Siphonaria sp. JEL0065]
MSTTTSITQQLLRCSQRMFSSAPASSANAGNASSVAASTSAAASGGPRKPREAREPREPREGREREREKEREKEVPLMKRVLHMRQVARSTKGGKIRSTSALVVVGNGNGVGGFGEGRAADAGLAIQKATTNALKNMTPVARFQQRTVFGDIKHRFHHSNFDIKTAPPGFGIVANNPIHEVCRCVGIRDLAAKVRGSQNPLNVVKGFFEAVQLQKTPDQIAQARGRKLVDIANAYYGGKV